ncbi:hypothetical protein VCHA52P455_440006 [Vibrio chagasii]|nr:hypothetical protein VCHA52P455_440006 [Vibrio chagasii]
MNDTVHIEAKFLKMIWINGWLLCLKSANESLFIMDVFELCIDGLKSVR